MTRDMLFEIAKNAAILKKDLRNHRIGASAIRSDGTIVRSYNGPVLMQDENHTTFPSAHAEARLSRKLDKGSVVFVCRVKKDGSIGNAMPCPDCMRTMASHGVSQVYYTIDNDRVGSIRLDK